MRNIIYQIKKKIYIYIYIYISTNCKHPTTAFKKKKHPATRQRRGEREEQALAAAVID